MAVPTKDAPHMVHPVPLPSLDALKEAFSYDPTTGLFTRHGQPYAGRLRDDGYVTVRLGVRWLYAHRVAWKLFYGKDPEGILDHIDRHKSNNRIENLREASFYENAINCDWADRAPAGGIIRRAGRFRTRMKVNGRELYFGTYATEEEARAALVQARNLRDLAWRAAKTALEAVAVSALLIVACAAIGAASCFR